MARPTLLLELPEELLGRLRVRAAQTGRAIGDEVMALIAAALADDAPPADVRASLGALAFAGDGTLDHAARSHLSADAAVELEALHFKAQREGLTVDERATETALVRRYERAMVIRAKAIALLHSRGYAVDEYLKRANASLDLEEVSDEEAARLVAEGWRGRERDCYSSAGAGITGCGRMLRCAQHDTAEGGAAPGAAAVDSGAKSADRLPLSC